MRLGVVLGKLLATFRAIGMIVVVAGPAAVRGEGGEGGPAVEDGGQWERNVGTLHDGA